jgi:hypothetical protein
MLEENPQISRDEKGKGVTSMRSGCSKVFVQQLLSREIPLSPLSSRAKPRDLRFSGPVLEMFFRLAPSREES